MMKEMGKVVQRAGAVAALVLAVVALPKPAHALPVIGGQLFATGGDVTAELLPSSAFFVSELKLFSPLPETSVFFNTDPVGTTVNLGAFPAGTELIFGIVVNDTESPLTGIFTFKTGPGSRNPDGVEHAQVDFIGPGEAIVEFEDQMATDPFYDGDLNDLRFRFHGVIPQGVIPEPASLSLMGLGLSGLGFGRVRRKK